MSDAYMSAIMLNEIAVTMAERGHYRLAFAMLKDAIKIARSLLKQDDTLSSDDTSTIDKSSTHQQLLNKACLRLARSSTVLAASSVAPSDLVQAVAIADFSLSRRTTNIDTKITLIRIDTSDVEMLQTTSYELPMAILVYNLAIVASLHEPVRCSPRDLLSLALRILERSFEQYEDDPFFLKRVVFVTVSVLQALIPDLNGDEAVTQSRQLEHFYELATQLESVSRLICHMDRHAPSA
jgi:hypothetical protein